MTNNDKLQFLVFSKLLVIFVKINFYIVMNIKSDTPQVAALKKEIEKIAGRMTSHSMFQKVSTLVEQECGEHISVTTLERLWGYSTRGSNNISVRILTILAEFVGAHDWDSFCRKIAVEQKKESDIFVADGAIWCGDLAVGTRIRLGWMPDRICEAEYIGNNRFIALKTENSSIKPGDSFCCLQIQKGRELYMDCFTRKGESMSSDRYVVGQLSGLTLVEIL